MTQTTQEYSLTDELKEWDKVMIALMGDKWNELTVWQKMCEVAALQEHRQQSPSLLGNLFGGSFY